MGLAEDEDAKRAEAIKIAVDAGVLKRCEIDVEDDCASLTGEDVEVAYRKGSARLKAEELDNVFEDQRDMTDMVQKVVGEAPDSCPRCAYRRNQG